jgi:acetyl esterase/lipase
LDDFLQMPVLYTVPGMQDVIVRRDIAYKRAEDTDLLLDVYLPSDRSTDAPLPLVLFIHGGPVNFEVPLLPKDWGQYQSYGRMMAASGLACVTFNHRLRSRTDLVTPASDVADAISYVRANAATFGIDPDRLCLWGVSGGGPLLSFVLRDRPDYVRCLVAYYARLDLRQVSAELDYDEQTLETFSAASHLGADRPTELPIFVARGGLDNPSINRPIDRFVQRAIEANACLELANHPRGHHAFDMIDDDDRTREIIARTIDFVVRHT